ncbi:hypothetical protein QFZ40_001984 [Arthrobacter pascens]|nr:hypothetical protein [Arthrobacter pascens]
MQASLSYVRLRMRWWRFTAPAQASDSGMKGPGSRMGP